MKLPAIQFYTSDWLLDHAVQRLTSSGRGIWINLLCHMSENSERGYITGTVDQLARWANVSRAELIAFIAEAADTQIRDIQLGEREGRPTSLRRVFDEFNF
jgi:hypothetical protein